MSTARYRQPQIPPEGVVRVDLDEVAEHWTLLLAQIQGIGDGLIQPYSGHATRQSLEICSRLALAQQRYDDVIGTSPSDQHDHARLRLVTRLLPARRPRVQGG